MVLTRHKSRFDPEPCHLQSDSTETNQPHSLQLNHWGGAHATSQAHGGHAQPTMDELQGGWSLNHLGLSSHRVAKYIVHPEYTQASLNWWFSHVFRDSTWQPTSAGSASWGKWMGSQQNQSTVPKAKPGWNNSSDHYTTIIWQWCEISTQAITRFTSFSQGKHHRKIIHFVLVCCHVWWWPSPHLPAQHPWAKWAKWAKWARSLLALSLQLGQQGGDLSRPGGSQGMSQGDGAALGVHLRLRQCPADRQRCGFPQMGGTRGTQQWMVYTGKSIYKWMISGYPPFQEASIWPLYLRRFPATVLNLPFLVWNPAMNPRS